MALDPRAVAPMAYRKDDENTGCYFVDVMEDT